MTLPALVSSNIKIHGQFDVENFSEWISHRAKVLDLKGTVKLHSSKMIEIDVAGNRILVDALEVACSLGPYNAKIDRVDVVKSDEVAFMDDFKIEHLLYTLKSEFH